MKTFIGNVDGDVVTLRFKAVTDNAVTRAINELQYELGKMSRRLNKLLGERDALNTKIETIEKDRDFIHKKLKIFSDEGFKKWLETQRRELEREKQEKMETYAVADDFLRRSVGDKVYSQLVKKGEIVFEGSDGGNFKITQYGQVYQWRGSSFRPVCVIRPKLPIPDQILAILTTLKAEPDRILREQRRR